MKEQVNKMLMKCLLVMASMYHFGAFAVTSTVNTEIFNPDSDCSCKATSKTFFSVRPPYQLNSPEFLANWHTPLERSPKDCRRGAFELTLFGGASTSPDNFSQYFMPDCKKRLHITATQQADTDILAHQLNIYTLGDTNTSIPAFESFIEFEPRYSFAGLGLTYKQEFWQREDHRSFWFLISMPITYVKTNMNLTEQVIHNGGGVNTSATGAVANATQAFEQQTWNFGLIQSCSKAVTKLGDVTLLLGYEIIRHEMCHADGYIGLILPAGNLVKGKRVFEPIVGHNRHVGLITGASAGLILWECETSRLSAELDCHTQFMLSRCERRSFDLKNKPWSRYMQVYADLGQAQEAHDATATIDSQAIGTPGINVFTQQVRVHPGFASVNNLALLYDHCNWQAELGYNFYARQAECVELARPWQVGPALKSLLGDGDTDSVQQIGNNFNNNNRVTFINSGTGEIQYDSNLIQASDLDLHSAAAPAALSHTLYGSVAYNWDECKRPVFLGAGASYEFTGDNTAMNRWMLWAKTGVAF